MVENIIVAGFLLQETCDFQKVFENMAPVEAPLNNNEYPAAKIGHVRADFDGIDGWGQYFPCRDNLKTEAFSEESQKIYSGLVVKFKNLHVLREFCLKYPKAMIMPDEYNFFICGDVADYWLRLITRDRDYNLYLHGFAKTDRNTGRILD